jgi:segregation and condensation protein A
MRSAIAATLSACLELAKQGKAQLRQEGSFGPLYLRAVNKTKAKAKNSKGGRS